MVHLLIVLAVVLVIAIPTALVAAKKAKRRKEERARQVKMVQGQAEVPEEPMFPPRSRKRPKRQWFASEADAGKKGNKKRDDEPKLPATREVFGRLDVLPALIGDMLATHAPYQAELEIFRLGEQAYRRAEEAKLKTLSISLDALPNFDAWWQQALTACSKWRVEARKYRPVYRRMEEALKAPNEARRDFRSTLAVLKRYDESYFSSDDLAVLEVANQLDNQLTIYHRPPTQQYPYGGPDVLDAIASDEQEVLAAGLRVVAERMFSLLVDAQALIPQCAGLYDRAREEFKLETIVRPSRPTEQDVSAWISPAEEFSSRRRDVRLELRARVERLSEALELLSRAAEEMRNPTVGNGLPDELFGAHEAAKAIRNAALSLIQQRRESLNIWRAQASVSRDEQEDAKATAAVQAAVRKLGFAIAQHASAAAKLKAAQETPEPTIEAPEPTVDAPSAEAYIHTFRRWREATERTSRLKSEHRARIDQLKQQEQQRLGQARAAVEAIRQLLSNLKREGETAVVADAADLLIAEYAKAS